MFNLQRINGQLYVSVDECKGEGIILVPYEQFWAELDTFIHEISNAQEAITSFKKQAVHTT